MSKVQQYHIQTTQRLDDAAMEDAPQGEWVTNITESVNLLNDAVSNQTRQAGVSLVAGGQVEVITVKVTVPDPFIRVAAGAMLNGWVNFGTTQETMGYRKHPSGLVEVQGVIKTGTIGLPAFTLPTTFRPQYDMRYACTSNGAYGELGVSQLGAVTPFVGSNVSFWMRALFTAKDPAPMIPSCFPIQVKTNLPKVVGVFVVNVGSTASPQVNDGSAMSVSWDMSNVNGHKSVKISNIQGLAYNRDSNITLMLIGG